MISIRTKLILFMSSLVIIIGALSCLFFLIHVKRQEEAALKSFGKSLAMLLSQDNEVKDALIYTQPAFLDAPIKRARLLDKEEEIGYLRISNTQSVLIEEQVSWFNSGMQEIPVNKGTKNQDIGIGYYSLSSLREKFIDFSVPVFEKQPFSEEVFAAQVLEESPVKTARQTIGYIQIGLSLHKMNARINAIFWKSVIPMGLIIILGGVSIAIFLTKYIISPLRQIANVTLDIAKGDLTRTITVRSKDEIGQLSMNFNKMTGSLKKSYDELKQEIAERKRAEESLEYRVKIEELIADISTNFINLAPEEVDVGINRALKMIGEFSGVDRSYVFLYSNGEEKMDNTHEWCAEGIRSEKDVLQGVPVDNFPWGIEKLKRLETIHISRLSDLPDCARAEKELQQLQNIQSFIVVPMIYGGALVGLLGFDTIRKETSWTNEDIAMLKMVAEIFVNSLEHKRMEEALRRANSELEMRVHVRTIELSNANELLKEEINEHKKAKDELKKYAILFSEISDLPYICDTDGNILFVNRTFEKLTGRKPEEFIGKPFAPLFDEENLKKARDVYTKTLEGESPQYELFFKDTGILCEYKNLPLRDEQGNIIGIIGTARDITERKRMENMLRETNQTLRAIILASPLAITVLDTRGHVKMWNPSAERIFGWTEREVQGHFLPIIPENRLNEFHTLCNHVMKGLSFMGVEVWRQRRDGSPINISISTAPLYDAQGKVDGILDIIADNTERYRMIDALYQAKNYAENLIETANVMVVGLDIAGNIRVFNKAAEDITGYKKAEIAGKNWYELIVPKDMHPYAWEEFGKWQSGGQLAKTLETPIFTKSGKKRYVSWQNSVVHEHGKVVETISFGIDITEQKRTKELVERMRLTAFVKDVSVALTEGNTLRDILSHCAEAIVNNLEAAFARIWTLNREEHMLELQASAGMYTHINGFHSRIPVGKFKVGLIARERRPHFTNSVIDDQYIGDKDWVKREGIVAFAGFPLIVDDRLVGVVAIFAQKSLSEFILKALASATDIIALGIDRKQSEDALRMSERKYRMLLENLPQRIFYKDKNLVYVSCNENYARDLKIRPDEIGGKTDYDFYPHALAEKYRIDDKRIMSLEKTEDIEEKYINDGRELIIHTVKTPIKDENSTIIGVLGIFWDITEKVALQMEAIRSRHLASVGELAAGVAHEINNPITGIINCAQILVNKSQKGSKEQDVAGRIVKEGKRIATIVKSLLYFARPGDKREQKCHAHVYEILSDTLVLTEAQLKKDGITLIQQVSQKLPEIIARPQQIQQVFLNILSNARYALNCKYHGKHENKILEIRANEITMDNCPYVVVTFLDRGTGIPASVVDKVVNPFFTTKPRGKGTGLGLSISHSIVSDHGGKLLIDTVEGELTKVSVVLPVCRDVDHVGKDLYAALKS